MVLPALVLDAVDTREGLELALIENLHRNDLAVLDEADAYRSLIEEHGHTHASAARLVGADRSGKDAHANEKRLFLPDAPRPVEAILIVPRRGKLVRDQGVKSLHRGQIAEKAGIENRVQNAAAPAQDPRQPRRARGMDAGEAPGSTRNEDVVGPKARRPGRCDRAAASPE